MNNNDAHIKKMMDDFGIEDYDLNAGWEKLERRTQPRKKITLWWKYAAAACLALITLIYFLLYNSPEKQPPVAFQPKDSFVLKKDSGTVKSMVKINPGTVTNNVLQKPLNKNVPIKTNKNVIASHPAKVLEVSRPIENIEIHQPAVVKTEPQKNSVNNYVMKNTEPQKNQKAIAVITEAEFAAMINIKEPKQRKRYPLTKYLASRARQLEYTGEKLSSQTTLIKF